MWGWGGGSLGGGGGMGIVRIDNVVGCVVGLLRGWGGVDRFKGGVGGSVYIGCSF